MTSKSRKDRSSRARKRRKSTLYRVSKGGFVVALLLALAVTGWLISSQTDKQNDGTPTPTPANTQGTNPSSGATTTGSEPAIPSGGYDEEIQTTSNETDAVAFAFQANRDLAIAALFPKSLKRERKQIVKSYVVPSRVRMQMKLEKVAARVWVAFGQYRNVAEAHEDSGYAIENKMYHVDSLTPSKAVITLFTITYFRTKINLYKKQVTPIAAKVRVHLRRHEGSWMWERASAPTASEIPNLASLRGLDISAVQAAYAPYLRGFKPYESFS